MPKCDHFIYTAGKVENILSEYGIQISWTKETLIFYAKKLSSQLSMETFQTVTRVLSNSFSSLASVLIGQHSRESSAR